MAQIFGPRCPWWPHQQLWESFPAHWESDPKSPPTLAEIWARKARISCHWVRDTNETIGKGPQIFVYDVYGMLNKMDQTTGNIQAGLLELHCSSWIVALKFENHGQSWLSYTFFCAGSYLSIVAFVTQTWSTSIGHGTSQLLSNS